MNYPDQQKSNIDAVKILQNLVMLAFMLIFFQEVAANGSESPDFTGLDSTGKVFHLKENRGNIVILYFSANWCSPCLDERESLLTLVQKIGHPRIVLVNIIEEKELDSSLIKITGLYSFTRVIPDPSQRIGVGLFNSTLLPKLIVIDQDGRQALSLEGIKSDMTPQAETTLRRLLKAY